MDNKKVAVLLMCLVVCIWGGEYTVAKSLMDTYSSYNVLLFKYVAGLVGLGIARFTLGRGHKTEKKDYIPFLVVTFFGVVMYFVCDYAALDYLPISTITIVLAFVPVVSILAERIIFKKKMTAKIVIGVIGSVVGVAIVIGTDFRSIFHGSLIGYALAFGAVFSWVIYNFLMEPLSKKYSHYTIGFNQVFCALILILPFQISSPPDLTLFRPEMLVGVLYLGFGSALVGYMAMPIALRNLGPTPFGIFSNFLPITSAAFAWIFLGQSMTILQMIGCAIVIFFSCLVIVEVGKRDAAAAAE